MIDIVAAAIALVWNAGVIAALWRRVRDNQLALGLGGYMMSLYAADRILPRVLVDGSRNFDAARTEALRPFVIFPDLLLIGLLLLTVRHPSRLITIFSAGIVIATAIAFVIGATTPEIPISAAAFWTTAPLRAVGILLLVDAGVQRLGWERAARVVIRVLAAGAVFVAVQMLAIWGLKNVAAALEIDLPTTWYGFQTARTNIPGWNNNIAASGVALGVAGLVLLPRLARVRPWMTVAAVIIAEATLLVAEYRTAIIGMSLALGARAAIEVYHRLRARRGQPLSLAAGIGALVVVPVILLALSAQVVPRLAGLNPFVYVSGIVGAPVETVPPGVDPTEVIEGDVSTAVRLGINRAAIAMWERAPLTGRGLGAWEFERPDEPSILQTQISTHNGYLWVLADLGLVGLLFIYVVPVAAGLLRRPSAPLLAWLGLVLLFEVAIVGIAHSRYAVMVWSVVGLVALLPSGRFEFLTGSARTPPGEADSAQAASGAT